MINKIIKRLSELPNVTLSDGQEYIQLYDAMETVKKALEQEPKYCDRNICITNEYNGIGCDECKITKNQEPCEDAISRQDEKMTNKEKFKEVFDLEIDDTSDCGFFDCTDRECKNCPVKDTKDWWNSQYQKRDYDTEYRNHSEMILRNNQERSEHYVM